jgi:hypothetical protein
MPVYHIQLKITAFVSPDAAATGLAGGVRGPFGALAACCALTASPETDINIVTITAFLIRMGFASSADWELCFEFKITNHSAPQAGRGVETHETKTSNQQI